MAQIVIPTSDFGEVASVSGLLEEIARWNHHNKISKRGYHSHAWFRGHSKRSYRLEPGVYRDDFTAQARSLPGGNLENKRLNLEREMLSEFRTAGAALLNPNQVVPLYFIAQHYGMPTRLLDWTANPLAGLFFAVSENDDDDGDVYVMEPTQVMPKPDPNNKDEPPRYVRTMRHPYVVDAIGVSFWHEPQRVWPPLVLPVRPDSETGRIGLQSSLFTLHMHNITPKTNPTLARIRIPAGKKPDLREELHRLNINQFSIYNDLDHLSKEIRRNWNLSTTASSEHRDAGGERARSG
jgi:hypothetical protein